MIPDNWFERLLKLLRHFELFQGVLSAESVLNGQWRPILINYR